MTYFTLLQNNADNFLWDGGDHPDRVNTHLVLAPGLEGEAIEVNPLHLLTVPGGCLLIQTRDGGSQGVGVTGFHIKLSSPPPPTWEGLFSGWTSPIRSLLFLTETLESGRLPNPPPCLPHAVLQVHHRGQLNPTTSPSTIKKLQHVIPSKICPSPSQQRLAREESNWVSVIVSH
jgi:hypothetical protein